MTKPDSTFSDLPIIQKKTFQKTKKKNRIWTCRYCHRTFKTKASLKRHYEDSLWEGCIQKVGKRFLCKVCKKRFDSVREFRLHWDGEHDDEALGLRFIEAATKGGGDSSWSMRPVERELIIDRLRTDKSKKPLRYDYVANDLMVEELEYGVSNRAMTIIEILGIPGAGKSVLGLTIARHLQLLWRHHLDSLWNEDPEMFARITNSYDDDGNPKYYRPSIRIGFNMNQTAEHVRLARMGDIVIQDEDPALAGYEARSIQNQIENLLKIMRKACVNMIFISPVQVSYISIPTMVLEVIAKDVDQRLTAAALYDRQHNAHGWVVLEILDDDDPLMKFYIREKDRNIENIKSAGGRESVTISQKALNRDAEKLYKFLLSVGFDPEKERLSLELLKGLAFLAGIKGSTNYVEMVVRFLHRSLAQSSTFVKKGDDDYEAPSGPTKVVTTDNEFIIELEEVIEDPAILEHIYLSTEEALMNRERRGEKKPRKLHYEYIQMEDGERRFFSKHAEAWYLVYVKGYTMQATADALAYLSQDGTLTDAAIANSYNNGGWRAIYQEEISGDAAEIAVRNMFFPDWEIIGGQGNPDIVNPEDETWIEVKCRNRLRPKEPIESQITDFEYEHVREGKPLKVVRIGYVPKKARIEFWNVTLNPEWLEENIEEELLEGDDLVE